MVPVRKRDTTRAYSGVESGQTASIMGWIVIKNFLHGNGYAWSVERSFSVIAETKITDGQTCPAGLGGGERGGWASREWWPPRETDGRRGRFNRYHAPALGERHGQPQTSWVRLSESRPAKTEALEPLAHGRGRLEGRQAAVVGGGRTNSTCIHKKTSERSDVTKQTSPGKEWGGEGEGGVEWSGGKGREIL
ncbi:hypothetical protein BJV77DRAFT_141456 [Russula vinacea]|nr:hypothetical protein BJV77DRAFT_141456 [Russula vinacea]